MSQYDGYAPQGISGGGLASLTPWTEDIDAAGFDLLNVGGIQISNPADTDQYIITPSAILADRIITLPVLLANDVFVFEAFAQTLTNKIIDGDDNTLQDIAFSSLADGVDGVCMCMCMCMCMC